MSQRQHTRKQEKIVNPAPRPAQSVNQAVAIVKRARRKDLGIIKAMEICILKNSTKAKEFFTIKHFGKIIKEQILTGLLIIFTVI